MICLFDTRWIGAHGIGRFAAELYRRLSGLKPLQGWLRPTNPVDPLWTAYEVWCQRPDVYLSPGFNPPLVSARPFVFTIYDLIHLRHPAESNRLKRLYYARLVAPAARRAYRVLTVSDHSRREIAAWARLPEERIVNVSCGVDPAFNPDVVPFASESPYVLYVGNHRPHKNLPRLLAAFAAARASRELKLLLTGPQDALMTGLIEEHGLQGQVRCLGSVPEAEMPGLYRGAVALVFPSLHEGFGLPVVEAMATGVPVLTSTLTSLPEVAGDAALLVDPYDVEAIADGIDRIVEDSTLRATLAERGFTRAARYRWSETARRTQDTIEAAARAS